MEVLFDEFGSDVDELTVAVLVASVLELKTAALTLMVTTAVLPTLKLPRLHVTVVVAEAYVHVPTLDDEEE